MDSTTGGVLGIFGFLASVGGLIYTAINHKRIRCRCCGKDVDMSVDVDSTEPTVLPARTAPISNRIASIIDTSPTTNTNINESGSASESGSAIISESASASASASASESASESASASASANEVTKYEEYREDMYSKDLEPPRKKNKKSRVAPSD